jgi:MarR family transcriptional regulator for hemolysin
MSREWRWSLFVTIRRAFGILLWQHRSFADNPQWSYPEGMTALSPTRAEPDLSFLLDHASHVLRSRMAAALGEIGLTARMHCVLVHALEEERTQIQLAEIGDMDKTTMVVTVDALEAAGLAERKPSATDRRARVIAVTEQGAEVAKRSQRIVDGVHKAALDALPADEREVLLRAMNRLVTGHLATPAESSQPARRARQGAK